ncbi:hypothetical protein PF005_g11170 [Phytophthora fragariae]|uniref:Uncharacterized protein n=1 Tax=Phytophthora fragariae TaxID=53985 RepID=A0A6A3S8A1_9STRA|nr:hypothetical protein PF003_g352 [Phytophthora fragariae]KAE8940945.1 hypothetical protein PF009_g9264 [Phytophthora fragariae]KAE9111749.1 hypothetical protein PF007_g11368 [Phytophthora fragariae]KAE9119656.1 hypothetical protein PF010_g7778 [Phytophthora fragariae]KAE9144726.1 hypothetical protein PF006_g10366 [Phytophthora fragariae]
MSNVNEPIRFGDVIKLQTKSSFVESAAPACLGFLELPGKAQTQLLVVPPVKDEVKDRFTEAEFIITPIRGEKQQATGTPLTFQTPFVLRTSDGKDGSAYSLNNKVTGQREGVSLQVSASKGEMYIQVEKEGNTNAAGLHYGDDGLVLHVVDSNRVRKTLNHVLTHVVKPKSDTPGGLVTCGAKGSALTFSFQRALDADGKPQTETRKFVKNPQARRSSLDALSPTKMDELGRADRIDSSEFSDVDSMSRSSSIVGLGSNPASPRVAAPANALTTPVNAAEVAARLPAAKDGEATASTSSASANGSSHETSPTPPRNSLTDTKPGGDKATPSSPAKTAGTGAKASASPAASPVKPAASPVKPAASPVKPAASPVKTAASPAKPDAKTADTKTESAKTEPAKTESSKTEPTKAEPKAVAETKTTKAMTTATPPPKPIKTNQAEPKTVLADASTFPPMPAISGPAPSPVVSPKASASPKTRAKAPGTPTGMPPSPKVMKEEEVAQLKAEAEVENLEPACGAKCSLM